MPLIITLIFTTLALATQTATQNGSIQLYTHKWCKPCKKARAVFDKVKQHFPQISFQQHQYKDKTVLRRQEAENEADSLPFPTLVFNCSGKRFTYQNDLTVPEVTYWVQAVCMHKLPLCSTLINLQLFHVSVQPSEEVDELIQKMQKYPHIRICQAANANYSVSEVVKILEDTSGRTMFLDYFSHNVRNYLIQSGKTAVALITNNVNTTKASSFFGAYLSLLDNLTEEEKNMTGNNVFHFNMRKQQKEQLVFLGLCFNSNLSKCVAEKDRKIQVQQSQKYIPKLLQFIGLDIDQLEEVEYVVAFKFKKPKFQAHLYHNLGILDQKFLFWLSDLLQTPAHLEDKKPTCLWNSLVHRVSSRSLEDIQAHSKVSREIESIKREYGGKMTVNKVQKTYHSDHKFTLCLTDQKPQHFEGNSQMETIIQQIRQHLKAQFFDEL